MSSTPPSYLWRKTINNEQYLVSNDQSLLDHDFMKEAFASPDMSWAEPLPNDTWNLMLQNTCVLGLYRETADPTTSTDQANLVREQVGFARLITDYVTVLYITDVFVSEAMRGKGLGQWMTTCIKAITDGMPYLRRSVLMAKHQGKTVPMYERLLGMHVHDSGMEGKVAMMYTPGFEPGDEKKHAI